jgi:crotonobetaine/carnitine-CoA ligase
MSRQTMLDDYARRCRELERSNDFPRDFRALLDRAAERGSSLHFFDQGERLTGDALRDEVYRLAEGLHGRGIGLGSHVAVMLPNCIEFPVTWLALGVLGAVMVPLNTRLTAKELDYQFEKADVTDVVIDPHFLGVLAQMSAKPADERVVVVADTPAVGLASWHGLVDAGDPAWRPDWEIDPHQLLSIQYTSGSTGLPKGCMLTQRSLIVFGCQMLAFSRFEVENILCDHSYFYIDPQWQTVMALYEGATLHVAEKLSASKFVERLRAYDIHFSLFPRPLVGEVGEPSDRDTPIRKIFAVAAGREGTRNVRRRFGAHVTDGYGMTEIGGALSVPEEIDDPDADGTVGVPTPFRECRIVRADGSEASPGEPGELQVRGDGVFLGYYDQPEANAESFVDGWFRTGDLFVRDEKGYYRIVGRVKDMIRRSSENISALEVEQALTMVPGVKQVAVVPVPDDYRGEEVKAYLLLDDGETPDSVPPDRVIAGCKERIAEYKVPRFIEYVDSFPYTPSQKVAKPKLIAAREDLRSGSWDELEKRYLD